MTPIGKNIFVIDEQGNQYEATYPKRAKGLVKSGRARFVNDNTICLACPPNNILEDKKMNENIVKSNEDQALELTMQYVLSRIDLIMNDKSHIHEAIDAIRNMEINEGPGGDEFEKAKAISSAAQSRETTNQQLLKLFEKMYDDLKVSVESEEQKKVRTITRMLGEMSLPPDEMTDTIQSVIHSILYNKSK